MLSWPGRGVDHGLPHVETVEEDRGGGQCNLRQLEHYAGLQDEVYAFGTVGTFEIGGKTCKDGGRAEQVVRGEEPLVGCEE